MDPTDREQTLQILDAVLEVLRAVQETLGAFIQGFENLYQTLYQREIEPTQVARQGIDRLTIFLNSTSIRVFSCIRHLLEYT